MKHYLVVILTIFILNNLCLKGQNTFIKHTEHRSLGFYPAIAAVKIKDNISTTAGKGYVMAATLLDFYRNPTCGYAPPGIPPHLGNVPYEDLRSGLILLDDQQNVLSAKGYMIHDNTTFNGVPPPFNTSWYTGNNIVYDFTESGPNRYLLCGGLNIYESTIQNLSGCGTIERSTKLYILETDLQGNTIWVNGYDLSLKSYPDHGRAKIIKLSNGRMFVAASDGLNMFVLILDSQGNIINSYQYNSIIPETLVETANGNIILLGKSNVFVSPSSVGYSDAILMLLNNNGVLQNAFSAGRPWDDEPATIKYNPYSGIYTVVINSSNEDPQKQGRLQTDILTFKCDENLNFSAINMYGSINDDFAYDVFFENYPGSGTMSVFTGAHTVSDNLLLKTDTKNNVLFAMKYPNNMNATPSRLLTWNSTSNGRVQSAYQIFKTNRDEYLIASPAYVEPQRVYTSFFMAHALRWTKTDLSGRMKYCEYNSVPFLSKPTDLWTAKQRIGWRNLNIGKLKVTWQEFQIPVNSNNICSDNFVNRTNQMSRPVLEPETTASLKVYSNPSGTEIRISSANSKELVTVVVTDVSGRTVLSQKMELNPFGTISLHSVADGVYVIKCIGSGTQLVKKIIKKEK